jgi:hypothetical protein
MAESGEADSLSWHTLAQQTCRQMQIPNTVIRAYVHMNIYHVLLLINEIQVATREGRAKSQSIRLYFRMSIEGSDKMGRLPPAM